MMRLFYTLLVFALFSSLNASPTAVCQANVNVALPADACEVTLQPSWIDGGSYNANGSSPIMWLSGAGSYAPGTYTVRLYVYGDGGINSCFSTVVVEDKLDPVVTCSDATYTVADLTALTINVSSLFTTSDNCNIQWTVFDTPDPDNFGTVEYYVGAHDEAGNVGECTGNITVIDGEPQVYCNVNPNTTYEYISRVKVSGPLCDIDRTSGNDGGYHYQPAYGWVSLMPNSSYTLLYEPDYSGSTIFYENWRAYLDINRDGDFNDAGELIHSWGGYGGNSISFTMPTGANYGWSRLRVVMSYGSGRSACSSGYWGEVEEYSVYLAAPFFFPWGGFRETTMANSKDADAFIPLNRPTEMPPRNEMAREPLNPNGGVTNIAVTVYPNPARAGQSLQIKGVGPETVNVQLSNILGRKLATYPASQQQLMLPTDLVPGIYLLSGQNENGQLSWTKRVRIQ